MYPPARRKLKEMGVPFGHHRAVQMTREDYGAYDFLLAMDLSLIHISLLSRHFTPGVMVWINRVCGVVILCYGGSLLWSFLTMLG